MTCWRFPWTSWAGDVSPVYFLCSISHPSACPGAHRPRPCSTLLLKEVSAPLLLLLPLKQKTEPEAAGMKVRRPACTHRGQVPAEAGCPRRARGAEQGARRSRARSARWAGREVGNVQVGGRSGTPRKAGGAGRTDRQGAAGESGAELRVKLRRTKLPKFWGFFLQ